MHMIGYLELCSLVFIIYWNKIINFHRIKTIWIISWSLFDQAYPVDFFLKIFIFLIRLDILSTFSLEKQKFKKQDEIDEKY
jgi:hypothetical protein